MLLRIVLALALLLSACVRPEAEDTPETTVPVGFTRLRIGFLANGVAAGLGFVLEDGRLFASQRIAPEYQRFGTSDGLERALAEGSVDMAVGLPPLNAARLLQSGASVQIAASIQPADQRLVAASSGPTQTVESLRGKTIGLHAQADLEPLLAEVLARGGLQPGAYSFRQLPESGLADALVSGQIDAALINTLTLAGLPNPQRWRALADLGGPYRDGKRDGPAPPPAGLVAMRQVVVDADLAPRALAAVLAGIRWGGGHPTEVRRLMAKHLRMTDQNARNYAAAWSTLFQPTMDAATIAALMAANERYVAAGSLRANPGPAAYSVRLFDGARELAR